VLQTQGQQWSITGRSHPLSSAQIITKPCARDGTKAVGHAYLEHFKCREPNMKIAKAILAGAAAILITSSGAIAQQSLMGTISKVDEANGKIAIQQTQSGTVGANSGAAAEEFKVQDGLVFNAVQPGDKVVFTATEVGGVKTITKLEKQ
jgi:Cu/Ag efflux protein CusF